jgi:hypothetical protein
MEVRNDSAAYRTVHKLWNGVDSGSANDRSGPCPHFSSRLSCVPSAPFCARVVSDAAPVQQRSGDRKLDALISRARASGLAAETIVNALRGELEFAAEMAHLGHRFCVQLIDLGPPEGLILHRPVRDRREILQTRSVNESAPG